MCGIFGIIGKSKKNKSYIKTLAEYAKRRGSDSSGFMAFQDKYFVEKADFDISKLTKILKIKNPEVFLGIGRLITNDNEANQPFLSDGICVFHNGIVVNDSEIFQKENTMLSNDDHLGMLTLEREMSGYNVNIFEAFIPLIQMEETDTAKVQWTIIKN